MNRLISLPILLAMAACGSQPAGATPDTLISIEDEAFAANGDTLFVLRTVQENLGLHTSMFTETYLVGIDVASGEEEHWLVYRERQDRQFAANPADERDETTLFDRDSWHNPYAIVAEAGAALATTAIRGEERALEGSRFSLDNSYGPAFTATADELAARAQQSVNALRGLAYPSERQAGWTTDQYWEARQVDWDSCAFASVGFPVGVGAQSYQVIRITCGNEYEAPTSLLQAIPQRG